jgi:hypothetical protein
MSDTTKPRKARETKAQRQARMGEEARAAANANAEAERAASVTDPQEIADLEAEAAELEAEAKLPEWTDVIDNAIANGQDDEPEWTEPEAEKTEFTLQEALDEEARLKAEEGDDEPDEEEEPDDDEGGQSNLARTMKRYRAGYQDAVKVHTNGTTTKTKIKGDELSRLLLDREPREVVFLAERALKLIPGTLVDKYAGLNPGQKRMNSGNRLRAAIKRGDLTLDDVLAVLHKDEA